MKRIVGMMVLFLGLFANAHAVPPVLNYAGQVTVNGEAFDGVGLFKFALVNTDGTTTYWSNDGTSVDGSEPQASVSVPVNGGLYAVLLGNTAQQGMGPIDPSIFAQHTDAKLRIWFSDGVNGFQQLSPDRPFASVPYAFSAGTAQAASSATIADGSIDRSMLSGDIRSDLNRTISYNDLTPQIKADINATIGLDRLSAEVISKLEQNATITNGSVTGSKMADGAVTAIKMADGMITTDKLNEQILKYLKPEITSQPQAQNVYADTNATFSVIAEGKYLTYQWKKDGADLTGETNATLTITDANATLHDGNYSVVVSNDFGSEESDLRKFKVFNLGPLNGIIGWWPLNGNASDISGNNYNGTLLNGPTFTEGKFSQALSFDGINDAFRFPNGVLLNKHLKGTISLWFKSFLQGNNYYLFSATNLGRYYLTLGADGIYATLGSVPETISGGHIISNQWYFVTLVWSSPTSQGKLYLDGIEKSAATNYELHSTPTEIHLGSHNGNHQYYKGLIDDVRIYDRALSAAEVQALYNLGQ